MIETWELPTSIDYAQHLFRNQKWITGWNCCVVSTITAWVNGFVGMRRIDVPLTPVLWFAIYQPSKTILISMLRSEIWLTPKRYFLNTKRFNLKFYKTVLNESKRRSTVFWKEIATARGQASHALRAKEDIGLSHFLRWSRTVLRGNSLRFQCLAISNLFNTVHCLSASKSRRQR